jgi:hypothetical protein
MTLAGCQVPILMLWNLLDRVIVRGHTSPLDVAAVYRVHNSPSGNVAGQYASSLRARLIKRDIGSQQVSQRNMGTYSMQAARAANYPKTETFTDLKEVS